MLTQSEVNKELIEAIKNNNAPDMRGLLVGNYLNIGDPPADLNSQDTDGKTALMVSACTDTGSPAQITITTHLLVNGANPNLVNNLDRNATALIYAAERDRLSILDALITGGANCKIMTTDHMFTALLWAAYRNNKNACSFLVVLDGLKDITGNAWWLDSNGKIQYGTKWNALNVAIYLQNLDAINGLICPNGFDVNHRDQNNHSKTALMFAIENQKHESINHLIEMGANVASRDDIGRTSLYFAAEFGDLEATFMLLGSNISIIDKADVLGKTPLMVASEKGFSSIVDFLIKNGASVSLKDISGKNALMFAAKNGNSDVVKILIAAGSPIEAKDYSGNTALMLAAPMTSGGYKNIVEYLIDNNANVNSKNNQYQTILMWAAKRDYTDLLEKLLAKGADFKLKDANGWMAINWAIEWGNSKSTDLLRIYSNPNPEISVKDSDGLDFVSGKTIYSFVGKEKETPSKFIIKNCGYQDLIISNITTDNYSFVINSTNIINTLKSGMSTTFTIKFLPTETGTILGNICITNNDPDESCFTFGCVGTI
jgi:serine/threonine-protein phosphatase 6 regulatory ankyrin repeat subunit B